MLGPGPEESADVGLERYVRGHVFKKETYSHYTACTARFITLSGWTQDYCLPGKSGDSVLAQLVKEQDLCLCLCVIRRLVSLKHNRTNE